jgi:flagellin
MGSFGDINRVNTNVQALDAQYALNRVNRDLELSRNKQVTGKQINKSEDDAAGYSIATKLKSRVVGLEQSLQNIADAKSILNIVESSFDTIMDSLIEMKSLATQASNETMSHSDRALIGDQIEAIGLDINETANQTVYQDKELLNGTGYTGSLDLTFQTGERAEDTITSSINAVNTSELFFGSGRVFSAGTMFGATTLPVDITAHGIAIFSGGGVVAGMAIYTSQATAGSQGIFNIDDSATQADFNKFIEVVDIAIDRFAENFKSLGITQSSLSQRENIVFKSIISNESAKSSIMDTDFAKEHSESIRLQILQQTATSALAQANNGPHSVLGFI